MFTICYWDHDFGAWVSHRRFTDEAAAVREAARCYDDETIVCGAGGRIVHGQATVQRVPRSLR